MPSLIDIRKFLTASTNQNVDLLGMTSTSPARTTSFRISGGSIISNKLTSIDLTLTNRSGHPAEAESDCYEWAKALNNKTNFKIGDTQIILIRSSNFPTYLGKYDNGLFYFTVAFSILMEV